MTALFEAGGVDDRSLSLLPMLGVEAVEGVSDLVDLRGSVEGFSGSAECWRFSYC